MVLIFRYQQQQGVRQPYLLHLFLGRPMFLLLVGIFLHYVGSACVFRYCAVLCPLAGVICLIVEVSRSRTPCRTPLNEELVAGAATCTTHSNEPAILAMEQPQGHRNRLF